MVRYFNKNRPQDRPNKPLFHPTNRQHLHDALRAAVGGNAGMPADRMGTQSLRKGAATDACSGGTIAGHAIKNQLRRKSDVYAPVYQTVSKESLHVLAQNLAAFPAIGEHSRSN